MYKHILIPTDGSRLAREAALAGVKLAKSMGARVTGFHAAPPATPVEYKGLFPVGYRAPAERARIIERAARKHLEVIEKAAKAAGVRCKVEHVTNDFPAEAIVAAARRSNCDLIFMPTHGRRGFRNSMLGTQTQKVLSLAKVPVLVHR
ncbi:MAG TPA: universal stress protein [Candidatus Limnocylindria bacterium]|nr:universal stress protein [Candidatus Limnocylindria bacterium]